MLCYYYNWLIAFTGEITAPLLGHTWSLAIEEQFYLLWPAVLACLLRWKRDRRWIVLVVLIGVLIPAVSRISLFLTMRNPAGLSRRVYYGTDTRADALFIGCGLGLAVTWGLLPRRTWSRFLLRGAALASVLYLGMHCCHWNMPDWYYYGARFSIVALAAAVVIAALLCNAMPLLARLLEMPPLVWIGRISYGLYLWHLLVGLTVFELRNRYWHGFSEVRCTLLAYGLSILAAFASYLVVERPFLRLKNRISRKQPVAPALSSISAAA